MSMKVGDKVQRINESHPAALIGSVGVILRLNIYNPQSSHVVHEVKWSNDVVALSYECNLRVLDCNPNTIRDVKPTNPKDRAATHRLDLSLFPQSAVCYGALGMTEGDCKYAGYNYRESGVGVSTYVAATVRHLFKYYNGEWADKKTRVPHLSSALACLAIIVDGHTQNNLIDDRPPKQDLDKILTEFEEITKHLHTIFPNGPARVTQLNRKDNNGCVSDREPAQS